MRDHVISASGLVRDCRHHKILQAQRPRSAALEAASAEGTRFGSLVERAVKGLPLAEPEDRDEPWHWFEAFRGSWSLPDGVGCEVPLGLGADGLYVEVHEPEPHVYLPTEVGLVALMTRRTQLLTAGRADLLWTGTCTASDYAANALTTWHDVAHVGDLKRSAWRYGDPSRHPQLMALGLAYASREGLPFLRLGLYDARDANWEWGDVIDLREEGPGMLEEIREMATMTDEPRPGDHCNGCWERRACPAAQR